MPTIADLILRQPLEPPDWGADDPEDWMYAALTTIKARDAIESAPIFMVNNVADFVWDTPYNERSELDTGLVPPFTTFWMEYDRPMWMHAPNRDRTRTTAWEEDGYGCLVVCTDVKALREGREDDIGANMILDAGTLMPDGRSMLEALPEECRWFYQMALVVRRPGGHLLGPMLYRMVAVDEYGDVVDAIGGNNSPNNYLGIPGNKDRTPELREYILGKHAFSLTPFEVALFFMNTRGIEHKEYTPRRKETERWQQKHGRGLLTYKTLVVETVVGGSGQRGGSHTVRSEHIVRGHKADYRKGPGLFGKHKVLIYRAAHTAGDRTAGRVVKDYEVKPPRKTA